MLSCIYLGNSGKTVLISNLQFETKSGRKYQETIYKGNLILESLKGIPRWESWIGVPKILRFLFSYTTSLHGYQTRTRQLIGDNGDWQFRRTKTG